MKLARIENNIIMEVLTPMAGFSVEQCFHPSLIAACEQVDDLAQYGWVRQEDGSFAAPVVETPPAE